MSERTETDGNQVQAGDRGTSMGGIEMLDVRNPLTTLHQSSELNDTMSSRRDESAYDSLPTNVDINASATNATVGSNSLVMGSISTAPEEELGHSMQSMSSATSDAFSKRRTRTLEKRAISGYHNDERLVTNTSETMKHKNENENDDDVINGKPRIKRISSEPNKLLSQQLAEFQLKKPQTKKSKASKRLSWSTRSTPYQLMHESQPEPTMATHTATLHPAKAGHQHFSDQAAKSKFERLDFDLQESQITHRMTWATRKHDSRGFTKWTLCLLIGVFTGSVMFVVVYVIDQLKDWNINYTERGFRQIGWFTGFVRFFAINILCALVAGLLVSYVAPAAAGSGIPSVKAWLNGSYIPTLFGLKTLIVKLVGISFSVSGFFVVGKEGPMVHTGSALASGLALGRSKTLGIDSHINYSFRNDADARDLISCGAAAGVSAAFGAPIGGMLFALEEVSSFWQPGLTWRAFFTSATSNFVLQLWLGCYKLECGEVSKASLISFEADTDIVSGLYNMKEFVFFLIMGFVGGIVGMLFNAINVRICMWRKEHVKTRLSRVIEVLAVSVVTTMLLGLSPLLIGCQSTGSNDECDSPYEYGQYTCSDGTWNPLAALFMVSAEDVIASLLHQASQCWSVGILLFSSCIYFFLAVVTYGISIPSGLFVPLILIGATLGHAMGLIWNDIWQDDFDVGTYALIGASAVLGGSTRMTISLTAIILEITNDIYYLMPIMTTIMVAKWVGDRFNSALYDSHVGLKDIPYLEPKVPSWVPSYICADDVMKESVTTLPIIINLEQMLRILNDPDEYHNAFPIIESKSKLAYNITSKHGWNQSDGRFVGIILRWHICIMLSKHLYSRNIDELFKLPRLELKDITDRSHKGDRVVTAEEYKLPPRKEWKHYYMDLSPYMSLSPHSISRAVPIRRLYHMFRAFGMRHLVVLDKQQLIAGIVTSHELLESNLEHVVERVHLLFDFDASKTDELFEERIKFLTGQTSSLRTSGRASNPRYQRIQQLGASASPQAPQTQGMADSPALSGIEPNGGASDGTDGKDDRKSGGAGGAMRAVKRHIMSLSKRGRHSSNNSENEEFLLKAKTPLFEPMTTSNASVMNIIEHSPTHTPTIEPSPDSRADILTQDLDDMGGYQAPNGSIN